MEIQFLGAAGTVTGSKYLVTTSSKRLLVDCGLFQGLKELRVRSQARAIKIHGKYIEVNADVERLDNLSAHADYAEMLEWLGNFEHPPRRTFLTHGEPESAAAFSEKIEAKLGWQAHVPAHAEKVSLD